MKAISADAADDPSLIYGTSIAAVLVFIACTVVIASLCVRYNKSRGEG